MNIKIGKYTITSDERQFIVTEVKLARKGINKGKDVEINQTFHTSLQSTMENILKRKVLGSKVTSIKELITLIEEQKVQMEKIFKLTLKKHPVPVKTKKAKA